MEVIRVAEVVRPAAGGIRTHVGSLLGHLDRTAFAPVLFAPADFHLGPLRVETPRKTIHINAATSPLYDLRAIVQLAKALRGRFDVVHAHGLRGALVGVAGARLARVPAIFTAHNLAPPLGRASAATLRYLGASSTVVAVSEAVSRSLQDRGIASCRIQVISNGVDASHFSGDAPDELTRRHTLADLIESAYWASSPGAAEWLRDPRSLAQPLFIVLGIGRLSAEKGFDTLLAAFAGDCGDSSTEAGQPRRMLIIVGAGSEAARLRDAAGDCWCHVTLAGAVADVAPAIRAADVIAAPSLQEGQGIVALEAMAAAKPVVAARVGGLAETILDGETGILIPPKDPQALRAALETLSRSPELARRMGMAGRLRVQSEYSLNGMIEQLSTLYRTVAAGRPTG